MGNEIDTEAQDEPELHKNHTSNRDNRDYRTGGGLVGVFARHKTAANLLMVILLILGATALSRLNTQFFPNFAVDVISVSVVWPGATAEDVSDNIIEALEPELRFIDGVDELDSTAYEGVASVVLEFVSGTDMQKALSDVESAVGRVTSLPVESERPEVQAIQIYETISQVMIAGDVPLSVLSSRAKDMRDDLLDRGIDKVNIIGLTDEEIWVDITPETLRRLDLTIDEVGRAISGTSIDLPSGSLGGGERQVRTMGLRREAADFRDIEIRSLPNGQSLHLSDIAEISDAYEEGGRELYYHNMPAVYLDVQRAESRDALEAADILEEYLAETTPAIPPNIKVVPFNVQSDLIRDRISLLVRNGISGLILVLITLFVMLNGRVAIWVAAGIPISIMANMVIMYFTGQSINMLSLFGMIMAIGIVVDDAIVVGEYTASRYEAGKSALSAAAGGALRMATPVVSSTLTTIMAFIPLLVIGGIMGDIVAGIPLVVISILLASLIECFFILPGHLRHSLKKQGKNDDSLYRRFRNGFDRGFYRFRDGVFHKIMRFVIRWRYAVVATSFALLIAAIGMMMGGRIGFTFFPSPEGSVIFAKVEMVAGTPREDLVEMLEEVEDAAVRTAASLTGDEDNELIIFSLAQAGSSFSSGISAGGGAASDTLGGYMIELVSPDLRDVRTPDFIEKLREEIHVMAGVDSITISEPKNGPPGRELDVSLFGDDIDVLKLAAADVATLSRSINGVSEVGDNLPYGRPETLIEVTPHGRALGFSTTSVGRQLRNAIDGMVAKRFPRGDEEVTVRVQFPRDMIGLDIADNLYLKAPVSGEHVPLAEIVNEEEDIGFARIIRENGRNSVSVTGDIDSNVSNTSIVIDTLLEDGLVDIADKYGITYEFGGKAEEQADAFSDMGTGAIIGLSGIYIVLAWVFSSYMRPIVVMMVIPLGLVGAVFGHYLMGYNLTFLSMIAIIGLSGIVVNDSIVLVSTIEERREFQPLHQALIEGSGDRLRAVLLTSFTTIGGLLPLMFETSLQAQFLIPMAITIVFGLALTTLFVLLVVPALIAIQGDVHRLRLRLKALSRHKKKQNRLALNAKIA